MQDETNHRDIIISSRHSQDNNGDFNSKKPRLGRRESEPHSDEINYLYDVLTTNFPDDRAMWDLHHYFNIDEFEIDIQFDVSFFKDMQISERLSSYKADKFNNRVPTLAINVLSKSTWRVDIGENMDYCRKLKIPVYVVYPAYHVANKFYKPPFLRAYILETSGEYKIEEIRRATFEGEKINPNAVINVSKYLPFRLGLKKRDIMHESGESLYRLILLEQEKLTILPTKVDRLEQKISKLQKQIE